MKKSEEVPLKSKKPGRTILSKLWNNISKFFCKTTPRDKSKNISESSNNARLSFPQNDQILELIQGRKVSEIMVPRIDIIAVPIEKPFSFYTKTAITSGTSRIPVFKKTIDEIKGILYVKDLLRFVKKVPKDFNVESILHTPFVVPETLELNELLGKFLKNKIHLAVVVDEYGGTSGIVTLEDVIEEIIGEIHDEYDKEETLYKKLGPNSFKVDARLSTEDVQKLLMKKFPETEFDTIGGVLYDLFGRVPKPNEKISLEDMDFTILSLERNRIKKIQIDF